MGNKYIISTVAFLLLSVATGVSARQKDDDLKTVRVRNIELFQEREQTTVDFILEIGEKAAARNNTLSIIPVLAGSSTTRELTPVVVRGRRAEILYKRRTIASPRTTMMEDSEFITAQNGQSVRYHVVIPFEDWMAGATLSLDGVDESCCTAVRTDLGVIADNLMARPEDSIEEILIPGRELTTGEKLAKLFPFLKPSESGKDEYSREGITVYFHQGQHNIDQEYRENRSSLIDILSVVNELILSGDTEVESILIAGFASPEGGLEYNRRLSERRAEIIRKFIFDNTGLPADQIELHIGGEDWQGLRALVAASEMEDREAVLEIIDNVPIWEPGRRGREAELMSLSSGKAYRYMYRNFFPDLREAAYITVYYKNK